MNTCSCVLQSERPPHICVHRKLHEPASKSGSHSAFQENTVIQEATRGFLACSAGCELTDSDGFTALSNLGESIDAVGLTKLETASSVQPCTLTHDPRPSVLDAHSQRCWCAPDKKECRIFSRTYIQSPQSWTYAQTTTTVQDGRTPCHAMFRTPAYRDNDHNRHGACVCR